MVVGMNEITHEEAYYGTSQIPTMLSRFRKHSSHLRCVWVAQSLHHGLIRVIASTLRQNIIVDGV